MDLVADEGAGRLTGFSGSRKRCVIALACTPTAVLAPRARLMGRCERGSAEVGIDSGIGSDIVDSFQAVNTGT